MRDFSHAPRRLRELMSANDREGLAALIHSVKGSASYLSSRALFAMGDALEHAARTGDLDHIHRELPRYADRLERLIADVRAGIEALRAKTSASSPNFDPQRVLDDIHRVGPLIEQGDYAAMSILEHIRNAVQGTTHEALAQSAQVHFEELALTSATAALDQLETELKIA